MSKPNTRKRRAGRTGPSAKGLVRRVLDGDQAAVSRALSLVTDEAKGYEAVTREFFPFHGRSHKIGLCGPPGSGKSSLVSQLVKCFRKAGQTVGVLAVDPTSPFTGGAFLGDRIRVQEHATDRGVFMRSLASRGMMGGLNPTIFGAVHVLEAYGCGRILIETVGTGQDEVDIVDVADTVLYVTAPYQGDEFQAMKAGAMEITDIFAVNKADLAEVARAVAALREALSLGPQEEKGGWRVRVSAVSARTGLGIEELVSMIDEHQAHLRTTPEGRERLRAQLRRELSLLISRRVYRNALERIRDGHIDDLLEKRTDPLTLGKRLVRGISR